MDNLTEYIKKAFEFKDATDYKSAIDYFYKALAIDNDSIEIMNELALLYAELCQYDRAISLYEQVLSKNSKENSTKYKYAVLCKKLGDKEKAKSLLLDLYDENYELDIVLEELFPILLQEKDFDKIIYLYKNAETEMNSSSVFYFVALAYSNLSCNDLAQDYFKRSFYLCENNVDSGYNLAKTLVEKQMYEDAEKLLNNLLKYSENDKVFALLAEICYQKNRMEDAIMYYSYAIKINSTIAEYYYKLGVLYSLKGFSSEAEQSYCKAVALDSENTLYNYTLAYLYFTNKKYGLAENLVNYILSIDPENINALSLSVLLLLEKNEVALAKSKVEKISKYKGRDDFSYYAEEMYYSKLNFWEKAIVSIKKAIEMNDKSLDYKYELAKNYFHSLNNEQALKICDEIISINSKYIQAYILKAKIYLDKNEMNKVFENVNKAMSLDINSSETYMIKGIAEFNQQNYDEAVKDFKIAVSIKPNEKLYYAWVAKTFYQLENYTDAYYYYKEAANIDISNAEYQYYMAKCSVKNGDKENALAHFSVMKRLYPTNIIYAIEYAEYLKENGSVKTAEKILKSTLKLLSNKEDKEKLKEEIKKIKK